jgi:hypothetical protein
MSSETSTVPECRSASQTWDSRPLVRSSYAPTANHAVAGEFSRLTIPGSNMFDAISITAPMVCSGPTVAAMSSMLMPF